MKIFAVCVLTATAAFTQTQPNVTNARMETRAFSGDLGAQLRAVNAAWFGYAVKSMRRDHHSCCWSEEGECGCPLEGRSGAVSVSTRDTTAQRPVQLEGSDELAILFRIENNQVDKIDVFSLSCPLDAGGLPFVWVMGVPQAASLKYLSQQVDGQTSRTVMDAALFAISQHEGASALDLLIRFAKTHASPHVRGQALFWLAQRAGERAAATITNAIENDPDTDVKKRAVFALSQLPNGEGVTRLIEIARTQRNREVQKQAFFWLGESKDPRALAFIEDVLTK